MEDLKNPDPLTALVSFLEDRTDSKGIVSTLQKIEAKLINEFVLQVGAVAIEPLLVEAYYYNCDKAHAFLDENCHRHPEQKGLEHFKRLYFHKKGYGGVDLCLSRGEYYLSFLLKCCRTADQAICRQTALRDLLFRQTGEVRLIPKACEDRGQIVYLPRKGLKKETYQPAPLAALSIQAIVHGPVALSLAKGKQWTLAKYAIENGKKDRESASAFLKERGLYNSKLENRYFEEAFRSRSPGHTG